MSQYYFVASALPSLSLDVKSELSSHELRTLYAMNLKFSDLRLVDKLFWAFDVSNLRAMWQELPLDERGAMSLKELDAAVLVKEGFAPFIVEFLERYETSADRLRNIAALHVALYQTLSMEGGFLARFASQEREIYLILLALRAKRLKRDLVRELQFEDLFDPLVASILAQKDAADYTPPTGYEVLKGLFSYEPKAQERELLAYRLEKIEEIEGTEPFSIDHLLGYMARLLLVESWQTLDEAQGLSIIRDLSNYG